MGESDDKLRLFLVFVSKLEIIPFCYVIGQFVLGSIASSCTIALSWSKQLTDLASLLLKRIHDTKLMFNASDTKDHITKSVQEIQTYPIRPRKMCSS